ncbi:ankyrin repeat domain-containing protein [Streptomyces sp. NBC_00090]|uniref:ankyrin repeat domain-containing protein n=1 Tax=Streptomyces sp. NBC_00090 TaxID=2903619 RepID=UPI00325229AB
MRMIDALNLENPWTPAHQAVEASDYEGLTRLLHAGADPNEVCSGMTLLVHAIDVEGDGARQSGAPLHSAMTAILLAYGADPSMELSNGFSPRGMAEGYAHDMAIGLLDRYGDQS